jgi:CRISPR-associated protein Csy2
MSYYLILKHLNVRHANALSSNYAVTAAPIMAVNLFAHAMGLKIGCQADGVAMIHHDAKYLAEMDFHSGYKRPQFQQRRASTYIDKNDYVGTTMALSLQPVATVHLKISLVIEFATKPDLGLVKEFLHEGRLAGGVIESYATPQEFHESDDKLFDAIPGNGFWLIDRQDLLVGENPVDLLVSELGTRAQSDANDSWLTPVVPAYALTSEPAERVVGVRSLSDGTYPAHAYGEPLMGLAQYVSVREFEGESLPFWRSRWIDDTVFAVSTTY